MHRSFKVPSRSHAPVWERPRGALRHRVLTSGARAAYRLLPSAREGIMSKIPSFFCAFLLLLLCAFDPPAHAGASTLGLEMERMALGPTYQWAASSSVSNRARKLPKSSLHPLRLRDKKRNPIPHGWVSIKSCISRSAQAWWASRITEAAWRWKKITGPRSGWPGREPAYWDSGKKNAMPISASEISWPTHWALPRASCSLPCGNF